MPNALLPDMARFPCQPMPKLIRKEVLDCIIWDFEKPVGTEFHAKLCNDLARASMPKCVGTTCLGGLLEPLFQFGTGFHAKRCAWERLARKPVPNRFGTEFHAKWLARVRLARNFRAKQIWHGIPCQTEIHAFGKEIPCQTL